MRRFAFVEVPVPPRKAYLTLLNSQLTSLQATGSETFRNQCSKLIAEIFVPEATKGLAALGLSVGPAIPLDIVDYVKTRVEGETTLPNATDVVREGVEMYLFPQFEGRDRDHQKILNVISETLELTKEDRDRTDLILRSWTGFVDETE